MFVRSLLLNDQCHKIVECSLQQRHTGFFEISRGSDKSGYKQEGVEGLVSASSHIIVYVTQSAGSVEQWSTGRMKVFDVIRGCANS